MPSRYLNIKDKVSILAESIRQEIRHTIIYIYIYRQNIYIYIDEIYIYIDEI